MQSSRPSLQDTKSDALVVLDFDAVVSVLALCFGLRSQDQKYRHSVALHALSVLN
ncbi:hypothetical protein BDW71DRAFT_193090 [Aspergillus fruticulosus]